jgi:hypothetical protein
MPRGIACGTGQGIDGREAARQAVQEALEKLGTAKPVAALVLAAQEYPVAEVFVGLSSLPGGLPIWGMSTSRPFGSAGEQPRSVVVAILSGADWKVQPIWQPQFGRDSVAAGRELARILKESPDGRGLLLAADGIQGDASRAIPALTGIDLPVAGGLAASEVQLGKTYQFGGNQWSSGALSGLALGGRLRLSTALAQGWQDTGIHFTITKAHNVWIQNLDDGTAAEAYAKVFGAPARQWSFPPLNEVVRLYPLGLEVSPGRPERIVRSPLQVEVDGSFRMNTSVAEGTVAHLMIGDPQACLENARQAVRQALAGLNQARPIVALVLVDLAWQTLLETRQGQLSSILREELGETPLIGAYTLGQITRPNGEDLVRFYNQAFVVAVIGEG